jgi:hypothetical protein
MSLITSTEMFINMKVTPSTDSSEYEAFAIEEWKKVRDGIWINGVYISGWLYWHLNHWKIQIDGKLEGERLTSTALLRDNEWLIAEGIERAEKEKKLLTIFGSRQLGKTTFSSSYLGRKATIIKNSQNLITGASKGDLTNITNDIDFGLQNVTEMFRIPRISRDWKSGEVYLGVKSKEGDNKIHSMFRIRNTEEGRNTEVGAGMRLSSALIDEAGKADFAKVLAALLPGLRGANGLRAPVLITGTGGDMEKSKDAEVMFFNPESNEIVEYVNEKTGRKTGLFISGLYRQDYKKESNLAEYLGKEDCPELEQVKMLVSDKERGLADIEENRKKLAKDPDASKLLKYMMYYPLTEEEIFLSESHNVFPKELLLEQKRFLQTNAPHCDYVELYRDTNNLVKHKFTDKKPINEFPHKKANGIEGVIQIWEMPIDSAPDGIYIAANDPYKTDTSKYSDSLGSIYIFKRTYDIASDKFQNMMVAAYTGRPKKIQTWYDTAKNLLEFYNAKTLSENMDYGFIQHCIDTNCAHKYLVPQPRFLYEIHANSTVHRSYGIHMTEGIKSHIFGCIKRYMEDVLKVEKDEEGETKEILGVRKIIDPMLIEEMIKYEPGVNVDRIIAFGLVLAYAQSLDKHPLTSQKDNRYKELARPYQRNAKNPFSSGRNPFRK